jgi:hypothetical protein
MSQCLTVRDIVTILAAFGVGLAVIVLEVTAVYLLMKFADGGYRENPKKEGGDKSKDNKAKNKKP